MSKLENALEQIIEAILDSPEYKRYDEQRNKVKQYPELKAQIDEFRTRNYMLQTGDEAAFDKIDEIEEEYYEFRQNDLVSEFLAAELAFCRMMQDINLRMTEAVHFE